MEIALNTLKKLKKHRHLTEDAFIHSDQGFHYTSPQFQALRKENGLRSIDVTPRKLLG